jgi:hypothetical protein
LGSGVSARAKVAAVEPREPLCYQCVNECPDIITCFLRYVFSMPAGLLRKSIDRVFPIKELPDVDAGRTQTKPMTTIGVEKNGPIVKLLTEHEVWVGYGFFTMVHDGTLSFNSLSPRTEQYR